MAYIDLRNISNREIEVLDYRDGEIIGVMDQKDDYGNKCMLIAIDPQKGDVVRSVQVDQTRIYESFVSYPFAEDYFYGTTVGDDYKLSLQTISKSDFSFGSRYILVPEGEVISFYPVTKDYLLVADEIEATDEFLERIGDEDYSERFYVACYLYRLSDGEKIYLNALTDKDGLHYVLDQASYEGEGEERQICLSFFDPDQPDHRCVIKAGEPELVRMILEGRLKDMTWDEGDNCKKNQSAVNDEVSGDEIYNDEVYEDEDYTYTTVYEEDWVKEDMIFREKVRIEPKDGREVFFLEGHALSIGGQVIILKSFLVL